jgi:hypothetical protein
MQYESVIAFAAVKAVAQTASRSEENFVHVSNMFVPQHIIMIR